MTNQDKKSPEDNALDLLLYEAFQEIEEEEAKKEAKAAAEIAEIPTPKLNRAIKQQKRNRARKDWLRHGTAAAAIFLVLFGAHLFLYNNVEAYRVQFQHVFIQYNTGYGGDGSIETAKSQQEAGIVEVTVPAEGFPFALWIPDGYRQTFVNDFDIYQGYCEYENEAGETISFDYSMNEDNAMGLNTSNSLHFDTEDSEIEKIFIRGNEGITVLRKDFGRIAYRVVWVDENYTFSICSDFKGDTTNYDEILMTMAKSIAYEE